MNPEESTVVTRRLVVREPNGLHMRPAESVTRLAQRFESAVWLRQGDYRVDAKSIFDVITLAAEFGAELDVVAQGKDAEEAADALAKLFENHFLSDAKPTGESRAS